jgi:hypothetical protein
MFGRKVWEVFSLIDKLLIGGTLRPVSGYTEGACNSYRFSWEFGFLHLLMNFFPMPYSLNYNNICLYCVYNSPKSPILNLKVPASSPDRGSGVILLKCREKPGDFIQDAFLSVYQAFLSLFIASFVHSTLTKSL